MSELPTVAIVGRPNVGKSTLLNRIVGRREAIVEEKPGVTRDRKEVEAEWQGRRFRLVDTGGWMPGGDALDEKVSRQSEQAIREADAVLLVTDVTTGVTEEDDRDRVHDLMAAMVTSSVAQLSFELQVAGKWTPLAQVGPNLLVGLPPEALSK